MNLDNQLWATLIDLNRKADAVMTRVLKKVQPTPAISREIVNIASVEVRWENLPVSYNVTPSPNSDVFPGNNIKRGIFTNKGSRIVIRELGHELYGVAANNTRVLLSAQLAAPTPYFKWNFLTSITQRQYADKRVSSRSLGRPETGSHLVFREPFILEPMETLIFECELLNYGNFRTDATPTQMAPNFVVSANFFGYREGM